MVESSLGIPNVEGQKEEKQEKILKTNPKPMVTLGKTLQDPCLLVLSAADVFQQDLVQFNLSKPSYQL